MGLLIVVLWLSTMLPLFGETVQIIEHEANRVRLQVTIDPEAFLSASSAAVPASMTMMQTETGYVLPYKPLLVQLSAQKAHAKVLFARNEEQPFQANLAWQDVPVGADITGRETGHTALPRLRPENIVSLEYLGRYRQSYLWRVNVFPFEYDGDAKKLTIRRTIVFDLISQLDDQPTAIIPKSDIDFLQNLDAIVTASEGPRTTPAGLKKSASPSEQWKIIVNQDGIYKITGYDLMNAGLDLMAIDFHNLRLTCNGRDVSLYPSGWRDGQFDPDDYFEFWGEEQRQTFQDKAPDMYRDPFTRSNTYWLSWESRGLWMAEESGQITNSNPAAYIRPYSFLQTVHHEENNYFDHLATVPMDSMRDHWFFDDGVSAGKKVDYKIFLHHPDNQASYPVSVRVMLSGRTFVKDLHHNVSVFLNGSVLFSHRWLGQALADLVTEENQYISAADLNNGENFLSIVNNVTPQNFDFVMLNWFEVTYPRLYRAHNDFLKFSIPPDAEKGKYLFRIDGFKNQRIDVYKLHQSKIIGGEVKEVTDFEDFTSMQISFQNDVLSPATEFVAVSDSAKLKPIAIIKDDPSDLHNPQLAADYLLIAHKRFLKTPAVDELLALRQAQGLTALKIDVQDIYDEFNHGQPSSYAIKDFLSWAFENWQQPKLKFVLFVGDGSTIRYNADGDTLDFIPVHMRQTLVYGAAASDFWYTLIAGDDEVPDISLGRLPVRTPEELEFVVEKMINYEQSPPKGDWPNRFLIIGGNGAEFRTQGLALSQIMSPQFETKLLFTVKDPGLNTDPYFGGTSDLLDYVDQGCGVITFHGHGGGAIWADNGLLRLDDIDRFYSQGKFPFILSMTCYTGAFESPARESLADALLFTPQEGAVAMVGASGVGWTWNDYYLQAEIVKQIYANPGRTIGEMFTGGKISYMAHYSTEQVASQVNQYHLLGDPAMRIILPQSQVKLDLETTVILKGDSVRASCTTPFAQGTAYFSLEDSVKKTRSVRQTPVEDKKASAKLSVVENFTGDQGVVRFYGEDDFGSNRVNGYAPISLKGAVFDSAFVKTAGDSLWFYVHIISRSPLARVVCLALNDTLAMQAQENGWYASSDGAHVAWTGFQFSYQFQARDVENNVFISRVYKFYIRQDVDVAIDTTALAFNGENLVYLEATIDNATNSDVSTIPVLFERRFPNENNWYPMGSDTLDIPAFASRTARIYYAPQPGEMWVRVTLDPDSTLGEKFRDNNVLIKKMTPHYFQGTSDGFYVNGQIVQNLFYDGQLEMELPEGALSTSAAIYIDELQKIEIYEQPDFSVVPDIPAYRLDLLNDQAQLLSPIKIVLKNSRNSFDVRTDVYQFIQRGRKWRRCETEKNDHALHASLDRFAPIGVLISEDTTPPEITLSIDGQPYVPNKWAGNEPRLGVQLLDLNGIDLSDNALEIELNGDEIDASEITAPDSIIDGNQIVLSVNPKLLPGEQVLSVRAVDCSGNSSAVKEFTLRVASDFNIQMLGTYPNPFEKETRFAYIFNSPVEKVSLKIFTASGRLIRHITADEIFEDTNPLSADYHEILWDGLDEDGYEVANGVYFYALEAKSGHKTRSVNGKLAKIK